MIGSPKPKEKKSKDGKKGQKKVELVMVNVGKKEQIKSGYWSKKPGQKAVHISLLARKPYRKGPVKSKIGKVYNNKLLRRKYLSNKGRKYQPNKNHPHQIKHYNPNKNSWNKKKSMIKGNVVSLDWVNRSSKT